MPFSISGNANATNNVKAVNALTLKLSGSIDSLTYASGVNTKTGESVNVVLYDLSGSVGSNNISSSYALSASYASSSGDSNSMKRYAQQYAIILG